MVLIVPAELPEILGAKHLEAHIWDLLELSRDKRHNALASQRCGTLAVRFLSSFQHAEKTAAAEHECGKPN